MFTTYRVTKRASWHTFPLEAAPQARRCSTVTEWSATTHQQPNSSTYLLRQWQPPTSGPRAQVPHRAPRGPQVHFLTCEAPARAHIQVPRVRSCTDTHSCHLVLAAEHSTGRLGTLRRVCPRHRTSSSSRTWGCTIRTLVVPGKPARGSDRYGANGG